MKIIISGTSPYIHAIMKENRAVTSMARISNFGWLTAPPIGCGSSYDLETKIDPHGKPKSILDNLFHPAKIQPDLPTTKVFYQQFLRVFFPARRRRNEMPKVQD
jgi:hypothetical protein